MIHRTMALALAALVSALALPAGAQPLRMVADRSDNSVEFAYDADTGEIGSQTSSKRYDHGDDVAFHVSVLETDDGGPGLLGKVKLKLLSDRKTIYDGWFSLEIVGNDGEIAYYRERPMTIHLVPKPGRRTASVRFRFDVPTDAYEATAEFEQTG